MNPISRLWLGAFTVCALAACGESDEAFRSSYRTSAVNECRRGAESRPNPAGANMAQFCECMVDGYMRATPSDRLKAERSQSAAPPAASAAMQQCLQRLVQTPPGGTPPAARADPAGAARAVNDAQRAAAAARAEIENAMAEIR